MPSRTHEGLVDFPSAWLLGSGTVGLCTGSVDSSGCVCAVWSPSSWIETFHILAAVPVDLEFVREGRLVLLYTSLLLCSLRIKGEWSPRA